MNGWIKLHKKLLKWEWFGSSKTVHLFIYLLMKANFKNNEWKGITVNRGQLIFGRKKASQETGISERSIRTCLNRLKTTSEITIKTTNKYSIITICKYDDYQVKENENDQQNDQQTANKRPANDHTIRSKEDKEERLRARETIFRDKVLEFDYPKDMLNEFISYWTEPNKSGTKMLFELRQTWDTKRRLKTWADRDTKTDKPKAIAGA